jgi:hypothetical protein
MANSYRTRLSLACWLGLVMALLVPPTTVSAAGNEAEDWFPLFDGRSLDGWTIKITGHPLGENYRDTYRVEDGIIKVSYDHYDTFDRRFGHLYTNSAYSHYVLRLEYLITGDVMPDAPSWTALNSGVMIHSQSPLTLRLEQEWPVSVEGQFLAVDTTAGRQTGNACTPGTHIHVDGRLTTAHIIDADSRLYPRDEWVRFEIEVHGHDLVIHRVNGKEVLRYTHPILDEKDPDARRLLAAGVPRELGFGHIALQAEGQPVWFRNIEIRPLKPASSPL